MSTFLDFSIYAIGALAITLQLLREINDWRRIKELHDLRAAQPTREGSQP